MLVAAVMNGALGPAGRSLRSEVSNRQKVMFHANFTFQHLERSSSNASATKKMFTYRSHMARMDVVKKS